MSGQNDFDFDAIVEECERDPLTCLNNLALRFGLCISRSGGYVGTPESERPFCGLFDAHGGHPTVPITECSSTVEAVRALNHALVVARIAGRKAIVQWGIGRKYWEPEEGEGTWHGKEKNPAA